MSAENLSPFPKMKLELVPISVADVDRARAFYMNKLGFTLDHDVRPSTEMRVVQLTPPGSSCSILLGRGLGEISEMKPGTIKGLHLVVGNVVQVRSLLAARGGAVGEVADMGGIKFANFNDPDGNTWVLQEIPERAAEFEG